jgi:hypothetical protein
MSNDRLIVLKEKFQQLKIELVGIGDLTTDVMKESVKKVSRSHSEIQSYFQSQILDMPISGASIEVEEKILSYYVELNKQFKLLGVDLNMLQVARNPDTWQQRQQQAIARLSTLIGYCEAII